MSGQRKKPARWRKARNPYAGGRWDTPMNRFVWHRDHGQDIELWRGGVHLATIRPVSGPRGEFPVAPGPAWSWEWKVHIGPLCKWQRAASKDEAKEAARAESVRRESEGDQ